MSSAGILRSVFASSFRRYNLVDMEEEAHDHEHIIQEGGDDGDNGDNHGAAMATGDAGDGVRNVDLGVIVDGILADLPEPAPHHILPKLGESDGAWPAV